MQLPVQRREFDMSRLQLLNANADKSMLSTDEAKAVASHLIANVPQVGAVYLYTLVAVRRHFTPHKTMLYVRGDPFFCPAVTPRQVGVADAQL